MGVLQARTREQIRVAVGEHLGAIYVSSASSNGATTTLLDNSLTLGATGEHQGKHLVLTSGGNDGLIRQVTTSSVTSNVTTLTFAPAATNNTVSSDTYELWDTWCDPRRVHEFINQAIIEATPRTYDPVESLALHADGVTARFDIPSGLSFISRVEYRSSVNSVNIHACDAVWDESVDGDVTASADTEHYKKGGTSVKLVVAGTASANDILATENITSLDLSGYDTVEFWIKSTVATNSADLQLLLDNTASCASPLETLNVPALTADTWTFVRVTLANPETDTAIISVGLKYVVDLGACTIWVDDIRAVVNSSATWKHVNWRLWRIDKEARDLVFPAGVRDYIGYKLLKLSGGDKLALLSADATATELDEEYITAFAVGHVLLSVSGGPATDPDARRQLAQFWLGKAAASKAAFPLWEDVRSVD